MNFLLPTFNYNTAISILYFSKVHLSERGISGIGFSAATTIAVMYGQFLTPQGDFTYDIAYRLILVTIALIVTLTCAYLLNLLLNKLHNTEIN